MLTAFAIALILCFATLIIDYKILKIPMGMLIGILAGIQTQPGAVSFAVDQTHDDRPGFGYVAVFPTTLIAKLILAQLILALFLQ